MIPFTEAVERRAKCMAAMMDRLGVPLDSADRGLDSRQIAAAARRCASCGQADRCRSWLTASAADPSAWRDFCPNAQLFEQVRR